MVKPDGVQRNLVGEVVNRRENKGFKLAGAKLMQITEDLAKKHYGEHQDKPFYGELVDFITSGPVFAMIVVGENVIGITSSMAGKADTVEGASDTSRGDS